MPSHWAGAVVLFQHDRPDPGGRALWGDRLMTARTLLNGPAAAHAEFLSLCPIVERHARTVLRHRDPADREESAAEAVAAAFESYLGLKARGKDPVHDFPTRMATFAVLHVQDGRHVGGHASTRDVLSPQAQQKHGFRVEALPASTRIPLDRLYSDPDGQQALDAFEERLQDNTQTPVPDQVAFRIDFPAFLRTLSPRDRLMASFLSLGHSAQDAAARFKLSPARITQLRQEWQRAWLAFQGEAFPEGGAIPSPVSA